jgi:DNA-binding CsgD family transcriptional regulator
LPRALEALATPRALDQLRLETVRELLPGLVRTNLAAWNEIDPARGEVEIVAHPGAALEVEQAGHLLVEYMHEHPVIAHVQATGDGRPHTISDFMSAREFRATGIYQHIYRHLDAADQISFTLPDPTLIIGMALNRPRRDFTARDRQVLNALRPHLLQAYRNAHLVERLTRALAAVEQLTHEHGEALIVLDQRGMKEYATHGAERLMAQWFPRREHGSATLPVELTRLLEDRDPSLPAWPLVFSDERRRLTIQRLPTPDGRGAALVLSELPIDRPLAQLGRLGLTPRQAQAAALAVEGHANAAIGHRLGISPRTVEKHLERAFERLGVRGRVAAANLLHQAGATVASDPGARATT